MHSEFWHRKWHDNDIGFHEGRVNALLAAHWPPPGVLPGSTVLVPLSGKSHDLVWLASRGHRVVGVELSPVAVAAFFAEHGLAPRRERRDGFDVLTAGEITIWCGDLFAFERRHAPDVAAVYDRASLVALPRDIQTRYATRLATLMPAGAPSLLVTVDYDQSQMQGPPFATPPARVHELFDGDFEVSELERRDALSARPDMARRGLTRLEQVAMLLRRRPGQ